MIRRPRLTADDDVEPTVWDALIGAGIGLLLIYVGGLIAYPILKWPVVGLGWLFVIVMTGYVMAVIWKTVSGQAWPVFSRMRGDYRNDPQLGTLIRDRRIRCWEVSVVRGDRTVDVLIEGTDEPNPQLLAAARDLIARFDDLERQVGAYVAEEAESAAADDPGMAVEIRALRVSSVKFYWPDQPRRVQIDFDGPDEDRYWSCEYVNGEFGALDYD